MDIKNIIKNKNSLIGLGICGFMTKRYIFSNNSENKNIENKNIENKNIENIKFKLSNNKISEANDERLFDNISEANDERLFDNISEANDERLFDNISEANDERLFDIFLEGKNIETNPVDKLLRKLDTFELNEGNNQDHQDLIKSIKILIKHMEMDSSNNYNEFTEYYLKKNKGKNKANFYNLLIGEILLYVHQN